MYIQCGLKMIVCQVSNAIRKQYKSNDKQNIVGRLSLVNNYERLTWKGI